MLPEKHKSSKTGNNIIKSNCLHVQKGTKSLSFSMFILANGPTLGIMGNVKACSIIEQSRNICPPGLCTLEGRETDEIIIHD